MCQAVLCRTCHAEQRRGCPLCTQPLDYRACWREVDAYLGTRIRWPPDSGNETSLREAASMLGEPDPAKALRQRFARKPGLIAQILTEIFSLSGYDDDDVREAQSAGN